MRPLASNRSRFLVVLVLAGFVVLEGKLIDLQVFQHFQMARQAKAYESITVVRQSWREQIRDRKDIPLAQTVPVENVYATLSVWANHVELLAGTVGPLLGLNPASLAQYVRQALYPTNAPKGARVPKDLLLRKNLMPWEWVRIHQALANANFGFGTGRLTTQQRADLARYRRWSLFAVEGQVRYYPQGDSLAQVLGFVETGTNGHALMGKWGIEDSEDAVLAGTNGVCVSGQDASGNELPAGRTVDFPARDGRRVILTIDLRLQRIAEAAVQKMMDRHHPLNASCIIVNPVTGEILAMVSLPAFSPQHPVRNTVETAYNHAISDNYEPGSIFKIVTLAAALDTGVVDLNRTINCGRGRWVYKGSVLHDDGHSYGPLPVWACFAKSSNIGFAQIALLVGTNRLYEYITKFGFDRKTGVPLPDETRGMLTPAADWKPAAITRIAIGQEMAASQLQMVMAYAAIANNGILMRPLLVREIDRADGRVVVRFPHKTVGAVVRPQTARWVRDALECVVQDGTGTAAALEDYTVAGKTGTAQISDRHHYLAGRNYCSFIGMFPASRPELVIAVAVDSPGDNAYGGLIAAPVFKEIAEQAAALYHIVPDKGPRAAPPAVLPAGAGPSGTLMGTVP